jgi:hypothetical protein
MLSTRTLLPLLVVSDHLHAVVGPLIAVVTHLGPFGTTDHENTSCYPPEQIKQDESQGSRPGKTRLVTSPQCILFQAAFLRSSACPLLTMRGLVRLTGCRRSFQYSQRRGAAVSQVVASFHYQMCIPVSVGLCDNVRNHIITPSH